MDVKRFARFTRPGHRVTGEPLPHRTGEAFTGRLGIRALDHDDHSRLAYTELLADEQAATVTAFLERALAFYAGHGIIARRLQTDNHFSYAKNLSLRQLLANHAIAHRFIPPRTPPSATGS